jgi:hypothetical protein
MQLGLRSLGMIVGLVGTCIAFAIDLLYSVVHVLGRVTNITTDTGHFWWGLLVTIVALVGSVLSIFSGVVGSILLLIAGIALFFVVGWWALFASPFLFLAAWLAFAGRREETRTVAAS